MTPQALRIWVRRAERELAAAERRAAADLAPEGDDAVD